MNPSHLNTLKRTAMALAASGAAAAAIAAIATPGDAQSPGETTFKLLQKDALQQLVDVPPRGGEEKPPSAGDSYYSSNKLLDPATKRKRGRTHGICAVTIPGRRAVALCTFALRLDTGTITAAGPFPFTASTITLAITGGTASYARARGTATYKNGNGALATWEVKLEG